VNYPKLKHCGFRATESITHTTEHINIMGKSYKHDDDNLIDVRDGEKVRGKRHNKNERKFDHEYEETPDTCTQS